MIQGQHRPYSECADSGVEWLGEIPAHWKISRLGVTVVGCQNGVWGDEPDGQNDLICVRVADFDRLRLRVKIRDPTLRAVEPRVASARRLDFGDLLLEKSGGGEKQPVGAVVLYDHVEEAVCSNFVARMQVADEFVSRFLAYLHAHLYASRVNTRSIKQSTGIQNLDSAHYLGEPVGLPEFSEQRAIAGFLDRETAKIDALVAKKERLIELLQEKRAALITRAVTRGLDRDVSLKHSSVEWLGEIPTHWTIKPLKSVSRLQTGLTLGKSFEDRTTAKRPYLRVANVQDGYLSLDDVAEIELPANEVERYELQFGDVLMTEGGDFDKLGRGCVWEGQVSGCLHQNHIFAVRPQSDSLSPHFLALVMGSLYGRAYFTATAKQSTNLASTNSTKLGNFPIPVPDIDEQAEILQLISRETFRLDALVNKVQEVIAHLKELRTALISAAVTGKIDVREQAA